jgi:hypothetical protein
LSITIGQVNVAPDGMGDVAAADGEPVAVAAGHEHEQFRVGELDALGDGQRTSVNGVKTVSSRVAGNAAGTTDAGNERDFMRRPGDVRQRARDGGDDAKVAAAGTPDGLEVALEIAGHEFGQ